MGSETATIAPVADQRARWKICMHEAGHAVAGRVLLKHKVTAMVFDSDYGAAYQDSDNDCPRTFEDALMVAAGKAAEAMINLFPTPHAAPAPPLETTCHEAATVLLADIKTKSIPDHVKLARWSIHDVEARPHRWARNYYWLQDQAELFVRNHQKEIVEVATGLFTRGIITLPAQPEKGIAHVD